MQTFWLVVLTTLEFGISKADPLLELPELVSEQSCNTALEQFTCFSSGNKTCIGSTLVCNGKHDCEGGEDEQNCHVCPNGTFNCFRSEAKNCISVRFRCDGIGHCLHFEDEENCDSYKCQTGEFTCSKTKRGQRCIPQSFRCDGDGDCSEGEDEIDCASYTCASSQFSCPSSKHKCMTVAHRCNGNRHDDCPGGEDEKNCLNYTCGPEQFNCTGTPGRCISANYQCDGDKDCDGGEDEENCHVCHSGQFSCNKSREKKCIAENSRCDGERDCLENEDEEDCSESICSTNQFNCHRSGGECIDLKMRCDGMRNCEEGEDEENCPPYKTLTNCELLSKMLDHNIPWNLLLDWLCVARIGSNYTTAGFGGLFKISHHWCGIEKPCNMTCGELQDDDVGNDIECAKRIHKEQGFSAFHWWNEHCNNKASDEVYITPCLASLKPVSPNIPVALEHRNVSFVNGTQNHIACIATGFPLPSIKWLYKGTEMTGSNLGEAYVLQREFTPKERPAKEIKVDLNFRNNYDFAKRNEFQCVAKNYFGEARATFHVQLKQPIHPTHFPYEIVLPVLLVCIIGVIAATVLIHRKYFMKTGLTDAEIEEFIRGNPNRFNIGSTFHKDPNCQPYDNRYEIMPGKLQIYGHEVIGKGEFGIVFKGLYDNFPVAIKTVSPHASKAYLKSLLNELKVMIHIGEHPGVVNLVGAQTNELRKGVLNIAVEFCELGDLGNFLRAKKSSFLDILNASNCEAPLSESEYQNMDACFSTTNLIEWSAQIVQAMEHLANKKVIHGDLATRNVLLCGMDRVKLTDFGLSKRLYEYTQYVKKGQVPLPWRWMAYESLTTLAFTPQSDIWAFGVTLWEIFSLGDLPYPGLSWTIDFPIQLENGLRPLKPKYASDEIYDIMMNCWRISPELRTEWSTISDILIKIRTML